MKRRCIIHFGMSKTGSSSIQESLFRHAPQLSHLHYLHVGIANLSGAIASAFGNNPAQYHIHRKLGLTEAEIIARAQKIKDHLLTQFLESPKPDFLISAEFLSNLGHSELRCLVDWLSHQVDEIQAVGYIRPPRSFMASGFQQMVQNGFGSFNLTKLIPRYRDKFEVFDQVLTQNYVQLWKFDPSVFPKGCVVRDFCTRLGIILPETQVIRANKGLSKDALALLYAYRKYGPGYGVGPTVIKENKRLVAALAELPGSKLKFTAQVVQPTLDIHHEQIAWMEERLGTSLQEPLADDPDAIHDERDLLHFSPESIHWLTEQLKPHPIALGISSPTPETVAQWMHSLRLKLTQESLLNRKRKSAGFANLPTGMLHGKAQAALPNKARTKVAKRLEKCCAFGKKGVEMTAFGLADALILTTKHLPKMAPELARPLAVEVLRASQYFRHVAHKHHLL